MFYPFYSMIGLGTLFCERPRAISYIFPRLIPTPRVDGGLNKKNHRGSLEIIHRRRGVPSDVSHSIDIRWPRLDQIPTEPVWAWNPLIVTERPGFYEARSVPSRAITNQRSRSEGIYYT